MNKQKCSPSIERTYLNLIKEVYDKLTANILGQALFKVLGDKREQNRSLSLENRLP